MSFSTTGFPSLSFVTSQVEPVQNAFSPEQWSAFVLEVPSTFFVLSHLLNSPVKKLFISLHLSFVVLSLPSLVLYLLQSEGLAEWSQ